MCAFANVITHILRIKFAPRAREKQNHRMKIGEAIKQLRLAHGVTQEDVALEAGTNAGNLSRIERGQQQPSFDLVEKIAAALNTTVADLYAHAAESHKATKNKTKLKASSEDSSNDTLRLRRSFHQLTPENKRLAIEFVKLLNRTQNGR